MGFKVALSCEEVIAGDKCNLPFWVEDFNVPPLDNTATETGTIPMSVGLHGANISIPINRAI